MTPIERIRQKEERLDTAKKAHQQPKTTRSFPRNAGSVTLLALALLPLVFKAILDPSAQNIMGYGGITAVFGLGIFAISAGLNQQARFDEAMTAKAPRLPLKSLGGAILGLASAALTVFQGGDFLQAILVLLVMSSLSVVCFGLDPRYDKTHASQEARDAHKLDELSGQISTELARIDFALRGLDAPVIVSKATAFATAVNRLLEAIVFDPERAASMRKYTGVYLTAVGDAAERFAGVYSGSHDASAREDFAALLSKLTSVYDGKAREYALAGREKLDVEMKVLDGYLARRAHVA
ncbi:hypothetical protein [Algirhabdus cladophorae]|uniref:hypothetical protein n=1 Tax=Algirhabdus cladophorae TaxID=3377108 RepID=UPI003B849DDE